MKLFSSGSLPVLFNPMNNKARRRNILDTLKLKLVVISVSTEKWYVFRNIDTNFLHTSAHQGTLLTPTRRRALSGCRERRLSNCAESKTNSIVSLGKQWTPTIYGTCGGEVNMFTSPTRLPPASSLPACLDTVGFTEDFCSWWGRNQRR